MLQGVPTCTEDSDKVKESRSSLVVSQLFWDKNNFNTFIHKI